MPGIIDPDECFGKILSVYQPKDITEYDIIPVPKPRQTQSDKWKKRPCVVRYRSFADEARACGLDVVNGDAITFILPMPKSWTQSKKDRLDGTPHLSRPDIDNLLKSVLDSIYKEDSIVWKLAGLEKRWGVAGKIIVERKP